MKTAARLALRPILLASVVAVMVWFAAFPTLATAQGSQGQDAVYNSSNGVVGSSSFIDASMFAVSTDTICSTIYHVLTSTNPPYPSTGAVIDARGFPGTTGASMTCAAGTTPWNNGTTFQNKPSTILLPATGANPIVVPSTWNVPPNTHLIGEGDSAGGTTIQAKSGYTSNTAMISLGVNSLCSSSCQGISVENLTLDGHGQSINGIANGLAQDLSYVDHVSLFQILGGLGRCFNRKGAACVPTPYELPILLG